MTAGFVPDGSFLTPENEQFVQQQLDLGVFAGRDEVINAGIESLRRQQDHDLHERLVRADQDLKKGNYTEYDEESLQHRFDELKARIRQQIASSSEA
jgi:Arc/MetJ-type ribon-helix-helix transcriptional regulator